MCMWVCIKPVCPVARIRFFLFLKSKGTFPQIQMVPGPALTFFKYIYMSPGGSA